MTCTYHNCYLLEMANKILEFAPRLRSANFQPKLRGSAAQQEHIGEWQHVCFFVVVVSEVIESKADHDM